MIPKVIHYIWFSDKDTLPEKVESCIQSWKKCMPDYDIVKWNEKNFDVKKAPIYVQEAFQEKKYAFVSDYVRLWVLYNYGGIYMDTDVETFKSFDELLDNKAFSGFEEIHKVSAWLFASEKGNPIFKEFMEDYDNRRFILGEGKYDTTPNPFPITKRLVNHGLELDGKLQRLESITIYPMDYFCPFNPYRAGSDCFSDNTYCSHHFDGAWIKHKNENEKKYLEEEKNYIKIFGSKYGEKIHKHIAIINHMGIYGWIKRFLIKRN